ncbi:MAG: hypothetical protein WCJ58_04240 [bacterium]
MKQKTNLQVLISTELETKSKDIAQQLGFNNLPEMVRAMLVGAINGNLEYLPFTSLTSKKEAVYQQMINLEKNKYLAGNTKTYTNANDMLEDLEANVNA